MVKYGYGRIYVKDEISINCTLHTLLYDGTFIPYKFGVFVDGEIKFSDVGKEINTLGVSLDDIADRIIRRLLGSIPSEINLDEFKLEFTGLSRLVPELITETEYKKQRRSESRK